MTDREHPQAGDFVDEPGPGADPGEAYRRARGEGQVPPDDDEESHVPDAGDVYRSGS